MRRAFACSLLLLQLVVCGCHTSRQPYVRVISSYDRGDADEALRELDQLAETRGSERDIISLNRAIAYLLASQPESTVRTLETTRRRLRYLRQTDVFEQSMSGLNDDSDIAWSGCEFEQRMVDNLQILASLLQNDDDSFALAARGMSDVQVDQRELKRLSRSAEFNNPESVEHSPSPVRLSANRMTAWMAAAVSSENIQNADATDRLIRQVAVWEPSGDLSESLAILGTRTSKGFGTLQVVILAGRISPLQAEEVIPTTAALLIADHILSTASDHSLPATVSPILITRPIECYYHREFLTKVSVNGRPAGSSQVLVDLNATAWDAWLAQRDQQLARGVVRRILKKSAVYGTKNALGVRKGSGTDLLLNLAGMYWESREQADLRQWYLLPAAVEVVQMELPVGVHGVQLQVEAARRDKQGRCSDRLETPVRIEDGRNTFLLCFRPEDRLLAVQCSAEQGTGL